MTERSKQEIFRIMSQIVYWGLFSLAGWVLISSGLITPTTHVNGAVSCFIEERLNGWVIALDLTIQFLLAGLAAILFGKKYVDYIREEISRSFYAWGAFSGFLIFVLHVYFAKYAPARAADILMDMVSAVVLMGFPIGCGFFLYLQGCKHADAPQAAPEH